MRLLVAAKRDGVQRTRRGSAGRTPSRLRSRCDFGVPPNARSTSPCDRQYYQSALIALSCRPLQGLDQGREPRPPGHGPGAL